MEVPLDGFLIQLRRTKPVVTAPGTQPEPPRCDPSFDDHQLSTGEYHRPEWTRSFRTPYAFSAPDYSIHEALGLRSEVLSKHCEPLVPFPGKPELKPEPRTPCKKRAEKRRAKSEAALGIGFAPAPPRWWMHEVKSDTSGGEGIYEIFTGVMRVHEQPDRASQSIAALRSGLRFRATPFVVGRATWLRIKTDVTAPLLKLTDRGTTDKLVNYFERSFTSPVSPAHDVKEHLATAEELWVEDNKQYIRRVRDLDREKGRRLHLRKYTPLSASTSTLETAGQSLMSSS
eukprot:TRINITY_DN22307_c0_g1_i1.p1 TRINITY_DN22307_c0_g1~~TRINITY_DN22307_c0_g1_i1.p1  ORF type:complete len:286 (+),score=62.29 TRINITY_DN22307_c0_g1_i1:63-920(+)